MRDAGLQALLTGITHSGSRKSRIGSAVGIGGKCTEAFTTAFGSVSGIVRCATRSGLRGFKVPSCSVTPCWA